MEASAFEPNNTSWISDNKIPDPSPLPKLMTYHVLVRPHKIEEKVGSIIVPDKTKQDIQYLSNVGRILAVGPTAFKDFDAINKGSKNPYGKFGDDSVVPGVGDYVVWSKHAGTKIRVQGVTLILLNDDELLLQVEGPDVINPMDNLRGGMANYRNT